MRLQNFQNKKFIFFIFITFFSLNLFSEEKFIIKTEYFDIFYTKQSENSAAVLAENADKIYEELADFYNLKNKFRLPVSINHDYQVFNAYFSFAPFNHIVLYETLPEENSAFSEKTFLNTFRHELTHAVTFNLQSGFWYGLKKVFGDSANIGALFDTTFMTEGAAVETESKNGDGRVNDEFSIHLAKQAKIESKFPKFSEVQGALDIKPSTTASYIFGGLFWSWIVKKYGQEKFAEFWNKCSNFKTLTYFTGFKSVYKISFKDAWKEFYNELKIPEKIINPLNSDGFEKFGIKNQSKNAKILSISKNFIILYDSAKLYISKNSENLKFKKILTNYNILNCSFSSDGRFLAINYISKNKKFPSKKVMIFDTKHNSFFKFAEDGISNSGIFKNYNDYYLVLEKSGGKNHSNVLNPDLIVYKINISQKKDKISNIEKVFSENSGFNNQNFSFCDGNNENFYFIRKSGMSFSLMELKKLENVGFEIEKVFDFPQKIHPKNLSVNFQNNSENIQSFSFCYVKPEIMPRFGIFEIDYKNKKIDFKLSKTDFSGGIFNPIILNEKSFAYLGKFYSFSEFLKTDLNKNDFENFSIIMEENNQKTEKSENVPNKNLLNSSKKAKIFDFIKFGTLIPFYTLNSSKRISTSLDNIENSSFALGATYISGGLQTFPLYGFSSGWDFFSNSAILSAFVSSKTDTSIFNYSFLGNLEFDKLGFKQTFENFKINSNIELFNNWNLVFSENIDFFYGRQNFYKFKENDYSNLFNFFESLANYESRNLLFGKNKFSAGFLNVYKIGNGIFDKIGCSFSANLENLYLSEENDFNKENFFNNLGLNFVVQMPLIPVKNHNSIFTFNLPSIFKLDIFPSNSYFLAFSGKFVIFNSEIQKSFNFAPLNLLYFNRFTLSLFYQGKFSSGIKESFGIFNFVEHFSSFFEKSANYYDILSISFDFSFTPNFGGLSNPNFLLTASFETFYKFFKLETENSFGINFSFKTNF